MNTYPFIEAEKAGSGNVTRACALLKVSRSAYYAQRGDTPCERERIDFQLLAQVTAIHSASGGTYGAPRVHAELRSHGIRHGRKRIARVMRRAGVYGRTPKRWTKTTVVDPAAAARPDLIGRDFTPGAPGAAAVNARWCGDITYSAQLMVMCTSAA